MRPLALLLSLAALLPAGVQAQQIVEGGMRFTRRNLDILVMSSTANPGLNVAGSAAVAGGTINTGAASSDVYAELNPLTYASDGQAELQMAGNSRQWRQALSLQRATPTGATEVESKSRNRGHLDQTLKDLLLSQPALVETIVKPNPNDPTKPYVNVQFTSDYEQVVSLLGAKKADGPRDPAYDDLKTCQSLSTCGTHVIELTEGVAPQRLGAKASNVSSTSVASTYKAWADGQEVEARPIFNQHSKPSASADVINIPPNLQTSGTSKVYTRFTVIGFSKKPDPLAGKSSAISSFATNNKTVGAIRAQDGQTPQSIADQFGANVEQLMQINNIPTKDFDLSGLVITIPADLSTVGYGVVLEGGETASQVAKRYGISVPWLLDLNGLTDPEQRLVGGQQLQIPGLRPLGSPLLPPAMPLTDNLEYADYGAYTTYSVTYHVEGSLAPLFAPTLFNTLR
jgi:LysM repeat protein